MKREMTCIACPLGCQMIVEEKDGSYLVTGNTCKNGEKYGIEEMTAPKRVVPTTVSIRGGQLPRLPVKTANAIPKEKIFDAMAVINKIVVDAPIKCGDVVLKNILDTGVDIVATKTMPHI